jgi:hypothetical protein
MTEDASALLRTPAARAAWTAADTAIASTMSTAAYPPDRVHRVTAGSAA